MLPDTSVCGTLDAEYCALVWFSEWAYEFPTMSQPEGHEVTLPELETPFVEGEMVSVAALGGVIGVGVGVSVGVPITVGVSVAVAVADLKGELSSTKPMEPTSRTIISSSRSSASTLRPRRRLPPRPR